MYKQIIMGTPEILQGGAETNVEYISHDHGTLRDGPCYACEATTRGLGQRVLCFICKGKGRAIDSPSDDCYKCGGNIYIVAIPSGERTSIFNEINQAIETEWQQRLSELSGNSSPQA